MRSPALRAAVLLAVVVAGLAVAYGTPSRGVVEAWLEGVDGPRAWGPWGPAGFLGVAALTIAVGVPRLFFAAVAGALFGFALGCVIAEAAAMLGCVLTFLGARALGREFVESRLGSRFDRLRRTLALASRHGVAANLLVRSAPVGNFFVTNVLMSLSRVRIGDMLLGTLLGTLPGTVALALIGSGMVHGAVGPLVTGAFFFVVWGAAHARLVLPWLRRRGAE